MIRIFSVLGRISNWPTVWSNCLAAWLLGGGGSPGRLGVLCLGATLLYTSGPVLNDAFDTEFDRAHRPERPIPSGKISRRRVWILGSALLGLGWLVIAWLGMAPALVALGLATLIVLYDAVHKRTVLAPALMGGCRFLLYVVAAVVAQGGLNSLALWRALALSLYVAGLSCLARRESSPGASQRWPAGLLLAPGLVALLTGDMTLATLCISGVVFAAWVGWCLGQAWAGSRGGIPRGVAGLLAGIVLVDWLAVAGAGPTMAFLFAGLFVLAKVLQRVVPAT
jgi:4-hydroxybenzoate polyprenyltransferase